MTIRSIVKMGHPVLAARAAPVGSESLPALVTLLPDMVETMRAAGGVGLAAPQIGESLRVIVFEVPEGRASGEAGDEPQDLQALINPEFEPLDAEKNLGWEGCLSIPGLRGEVPRFSRIRYRGLDGEGNRIERDASGFHARVVQHEIDHLDGVLYPERMTDMRQFGFVDEILAHAAAAAPGAEILAHAAAAAPGAEILAHAAAAAPGAEILAHAAATATSVATGDADENET